MHTTVQAVIAPMFLITGVSHVVAPRRWAEFFRVMRQTGVAPFIIAMYTLPLGLVLVVLHNRWEWGWPLFLTVVGWGHLIKGTLYFVLPGVADWVLRRAEQHPPRKFQIAGAPMAFFGGVLTWQAVAQMISN